MFQTSWFLCLKLLLLIHSCTATVCQVRPLGYAYHKHSVTDSERALANCRMYPSGLVINGGSEQYIHCDGSQLRLADSDLGSEQFNSSDCYVWTAGRTKRQLLFIFPIRVNLTTITLHYYSDSVRGLPRLILYAVPDYFNVWDTPLTNYSSVQVTGVPRGGEPAGRRIAKVSFNVSTRKILMISLNSASNEFAVSEVMFFTCNVTTTVTSDGTSTTAASSTKLNNTSTTLDLVYPSNTTAVIIPRTLEVKNTTTEHVKLFHSSTLTNKDQFIPDYSQINIVLPVVLTAIVVTIVLVVLLVLLLLLYGKRKHNLKTNVELDTTYSTLNRETKQQLQPQSLDPSADLYDQIKLSPSTGQTEHISKSESKNVIILTSPTISDYKNMKKRQEGYREKSTAEYATYALVDKKKKKNSKKEELNESQDRAPEKVCTQKHLYKLKDELVQADEVEKREHQESQRKENLEEMYAVVQKKQKKHGEEETAPPPVPIHTIESLYAVVEKKPRHE